MKLKIYSLPHLTLKGMAQVICIILISNITMLGQTPDNNQEELSKLTVLIGKGLIDVEHGITIDHPVIYIRNGVIEKVGTNLEIPENAKIINLSNNYIMPGMIDAHTHLCHEYNRDLNTVPGANTIAETVLLSEGDRALLGARNAREMLYSGFTSARDLGNSGIGAAISLRNAINNNWVIGPRLFTSTRALSPIGGQFVKMTPEIHSSIVLREYVEINNVDEARKAVRQTIYDGADVIKVIVNNGRLVLSEEELTAIVEEAKRAGLKIAAHATNGDLPSLLAVKAGVNSIEHGYTISSDVLKLMAEKDIYLVPTDREGVDRYQKRIQRALAANVKIAFGSDKYYKVNGQTRGQLAIGTYQSYKLAGMSNLQILQSATMNPGNLIAGKEKIGLLKQGYYADIIAVEENPLENIQTLENVLFVMKEGIIYKNTDN